MRTINKTIKNKNAITLIALIITIIIMLILAGVSINIIFSENGLLKRAKYATQAYKAGEIQEKIELGIYDIQIENHKENKKTTIDDLINNLPSKVKDLSIEKDGNTAKGICEGYKYTIDDNLKVTVEGAIKVEASSTNTTLEETKQEVDIGDIADETKDVEIESYMAVKVNSNNRLNLTGINNVSYRLIAATSNVVFENETVKVNASATTADKCEVEATGTFTNNSGTELGYKNTITIYVESNKKTTVEDKDGNKQDAFAIYTAQDLIRLRELVNGGVGSTQNALLMNDIDLDGIDWMPMGYTLGYEDEEFEIMIGAIYEGIIDGNGSTINNLKISEDIQEELMENIGFIGVAGDTLIKNLKFTNVDIEAVKGGTAVVAASIWDTTIYNVSVESGQIHAVNDSANNAGGICAWADTNVKIQKCFNKVNIDINGDYNAGICGYAHNCQIIECYNEGNVKGNGTYVGGICGVTNETTITRCDNRGAVETTGENEYGSYIGGMIGSANASTINQCANYARVKGKGNFVGGIVGVLDGNVNECYNEGEIITEENDAGGISGINYLVAIIANSYNKGAITANESNGGGISGGSHNASDTKMTIKNCYNSGTISANKQAGGIIGHLYKSVDSIKNSYNVGNISASTYKGNIAGRNSGSINNSYFLNTIASGYATGNSKTVSGITGLSSINITNMINTLETENTIKLWSQSNVAGYTYPMLKWQIEESQKN